MKNAGVCHPTPPGSAAGEYFVRDCRKFSLHHCRTIAAASSLARLTGMSLASAFDRDGRGTNNRSTEDLKSSMTVEQYIADLDELVDAVCTRIGQNKVA